MQRIALFVMTGVGALIVGVVLGVNVLAESRLFKQFGATHEGSDSTVVHELDDVSHLAQRLEVLQMRLEGAESRLQSQQQVLQHLSDDMASLHADRSAAEGQIEQNDDVTERPQQSTSISSFIDAGFSLDDAAQLEARYADLELKRLYLRDRAVREGWVSAPRFGEERARLDAEEEVIADDLGEDAYDRYLYATGQPNRLSVLSVIRKSPAEANGIEAGDVFYSYAGARIYNSFDLRNATSDGAAGELVTVEVLRNNSVVQLYVPRGPLGVQLENRSVAP